MLHSREGGGGARAGRVTVLLLAAAVLAGPACGALEQAKTRPVMIVGDSLSAFGDARIRDVLEPAGWKVTIDAYPGVTVASEMSKLVKAARDRQRPIVIELGTNDAQALARGKGDAGDERAVIDRALDLFAPTQCVVWVNADANPSRPGGGGGRIVNDTLTAEAAKRARVQIADLDALLRNHPEYLVDDAVHLTDAGSTALGHLIADGLTACG